MTSSLYLSTTEARSGKSLVVLGILDLILKKTTRIAYFRPIIQTQLMANMITTLFWCWKIFVSNKPIPIPLVCISMKR